MKAAEVAAGGLEGTGRDWRGGRGGRGGGGMESGVVKRS